MERRPPSGSSQIAPSPAGFGSRRDILLIACTAGWTAFVCEAIFLLILLVMPSAPPAARANVDTPRVNRTPVQTAQPIPPKPVRPQQAATLPPAPTPDAPTPDAPVAADESNPYAAGSANVLGLTVDEPTTIVFDAVDRVEPWLDEVKGALVAGLTKPGPPVELIVLQKDKMVKWNPKPQEPGPKRRKSLETFVSGIEALEAPQQFWDAFDAGVAGVGERFIFITARTDGWGSIVNQLDEHLDRGGSTRLDVVQLGETVPELRAFVQGANGGRYTVVDDATFEGWSR